jgi:hypothetical protein
MRRKLLKNMEFCAGFGWRQGVFYDASRFVEAGTIRLFKAENVKSKMQNYEQSIFILRFIFLILH